MPRGPAVANRLAPKNPGGGASDADDAAASGHPLEQSSPGESAGTERRDHPQDLAAAWAAAASRRAVQTVDRPALRRTAAQHRGAVSESPRKGGRLLSGRKADQALDRTRPVRPDCRLATLFPAPQARSPHRVRASRVRLRAGRCPLCGGKPSGCRTPRCCAQ